jgi:hypothetical protein
MEILMGFIVLRPTFEGDLFFLTVIWYGIIMHVIKFKSTISNEKKSISESQVCDMYCDQVSESTKNR